MRYRIKWHFDVGASTFTDFGIAFMALLGNQGWQYTGTIDVTAGTALLDGFIIVPSKPESIYNISDAVMADFKARGWKFQGEHHWEFYREGASDGA